MQQADTQLAQPPAQIVVGLGVMLVAERAVSGLLYNIVDLVGILEDTLFRFLWNTPRLGWLAIVVVLGGWIVLASAAKLDQVVIGAAAAAYVLMTVIIDNILLDLPRIVANLYSLLPPLILLVAAAVAFLKLQEAAGSSNAGAPSSGWGSPAAAAPQGAPSPTPAPAPRPPAPAPAATPAPPASREPAWLPDPKGEAALRWWDGSTWTDNTHDG